MKTFKNSLFTLLILTFSINAQAQEKSTVRTSLNGVYANDFREGGINVNFEYFFSDKFSAATGWTYFFVGGDGNFSQSNIEGRYYFVKKPIQVYAMGGFGIFRRTYRDNEKAVTRGLSGGLGAVVAITDRLGFNVQAKYSDAARSFIQQGGITYNIRKWKGRPDWHLVT